MAEAQPIDAEVVDEGIRPKITPLPEVKPTWQGTFRSPFFWLMTGVICTIGYYEWCRYNDKQKGKMSR